MMGKAQDEEKMKIKGSAIGDQGVYAQTPFWVFQEAEIIGNDFW